MRRRSCEGTQRSSLLPSLGQKGDNSLVGLTARAQSPPPVHLRRSSNIAISLCLPTQVSLSSVIPSDRSAEQPQRKECCLQASDASGHASSFRPLGLARSPS